ncbi:unnamed protein product [Urochloa humidicola]
MGQIRKSTCLLHNYESGSCVKCNLPPHDGDDLIRNGKSDGDNHFQGLRRGSVLVFNSGLAIYNSWGEASSVAFVLTSTAALALLLVCLRELERGEGRDRIKAVVWAFSTLLMAMFTSRVWVAPLMPPIVEAAMWLIAVATIAGVFWAFFLF